jgi:hypothetical protein
MLQVIGEILPEALAIAFNPAAVIVVILLLISQRGKNKALAYLLGWLIGLSALCYVVYLMMEAIRSPRWGLPHRFSGLQLLLGLLFIAMAIYEFRLIPRQKQNEPPRYKWLDKLDDFTLLEVFAVAAAMAGLNLKNAGLVLSASTSLWNSGLYSAPPWVIFTVFPLLGSMPIIVPVLYGYMRGPQAQGRLSEWRDWLLINNALVLFVLFLFLGAKLIGAGLIGLK